MDDKLKAIKQEFLRVGLNVKRSLSFGSGGIVPSKTPDNYQPLLPGERMCKVIKCAYCGIELGYESLAGITIKVDDLSWCDTVCHDTWLDEIEETGVTKCIHCDNLAYQRDGKVYKLCARCGWDAIKEICEYNETEEV